MTNKLISAAVLLSPLALFAQKKQETPNLLIIMPDQYRATAMGFLGIEPVHTPNIDKLAKDGVVFNQAVSNYPVSSPARAMLMSGKYPCSNGVIGNCRTGNDGMELKTNEVCWSDVLKSKGYNMAYLGKWHLDAPHEPYIICANNKEVKWNEFCPPNRRHGFDYWLGYGTYDFHMRPLYWATDTPRDDFFYVDQYSPEYEADKAIEYLKTIENSDKPFAMMMSINPPHSIYSEVPQRYKDMYEDLDVEKAASIFPNIPEKGTKMGDHYRKNIKNYYSQITGVDDQIGRVINYLKETNRYDNTLIIFLSDHGDCLGIHNQQSKNNHYEESMRIPMIMVYPEKLKARMDNETLISIADIYPTMLSMLGFGKDIPKSVQTYNHGTEILKNQTSKKAEFQTYYQIAGKSIDFKGLRGLRDARYTYVMDVRKNKIVEEFLYDRVNDPYQQNNIANVELKTTLQMRAKLIRRLQKEGDLLVIND